MIRSAIVVFILVAFAGVASAADTPDILVTPHRLADHLDDPGWVVVQTADIRGDFLRGHIPGARFLWPGWLERSSPELTIELVSIDEAVSVLEDIGISDSSRVVLCHTYSFASAASAARIWAVFDYLGMGERTKILDGGFEAWKAAGLPVETGSTGNARGTLLPRIEKNVFVDADYVRSRADNSGVRLVDSRRAADYHGGDGADDRTGHIPGAVSLPYASVVDPDLRYLPADTLRTRFAVAGIEPGDEIISYCYRGKAACLIYVAARLLGREARVYDGSFEDWRVRVELPLEVTAAGQ